MARFLWGSAEVFATPEGGSAYGATMTVYADALGTILADIAEWDGSAVPGDVIADATLPVDALSRTPPFWGPDSAVPTLYVSASGGPLRSALRLSTSMPQLVAGDFTAPYVAAEPTIPLTWPPTLATYKADLKLDQDERWDVALQYSLDAAVAYVERVRTDVTYSGLDEDLEPVSADLVLGTLRYARRLDSRRDSPLGALIVGTLGAANVPGWDADIERLLRTGRYAKIRFA